MPTVLLIDDDESLLDLLSLAFEDAGHRVLRATDGAEGLGTYNREKPALVVCDVNMPRLDGFALCRKLRDAGDRVPFVLLTSRDGEIDQALGLDLGADDYVTKPFSTRVLLSRVHALLRRAQAPEAPRRVVSSGPLRLDLDRIEVHFAGRPVACTLTEFRLLEALCGRPGVVFSRGQLMERARGDEPPVNDRIVDTYVRRLRRKFEEIDPAFAALETVVGAGYRWAERG